MNDKNKNVQRTLVNQNGKLCEEVSRGGVTSTMPVDIALKEEQELGSVKFHPEPCPLLETPFQVSVFDTDETTKEYLDELAEKAKQDVGVSNRALATLSRYGQKQDRAKLDLQFGGQICSCPDDYMLE